LIRECGRRSKKLKKILKSKTHEELLAMMTLSTRSCRANRKRAEKINMTNEEFQAILDEIRNE